MKVSIFWFRRDLRLSDNTALIHALNSDNKVQPIFIFDSQIIDELPDDDPRVNFIYQSLDEINKSLIQKGGSIDVRKGNVLDIWADLLSSYDISEVYINKDHEPYAVQRDQQVRDLLSTHNIVLKEYKDQTIFEGNEIVKNDGLPYTVYTPYRNKWMQHFADVDLTTSHSTDLSNLHQHSIDFPSAASLGFRTSLISVRPFDLTTLASYAVNRDRPDKNATSYLGPHLRFGTVSVRQIIEQTAEQSAVFLNEIIWREFFMQILYHFPRVVNSNFKKKYDLIEWRNDESEFEKWCQGKTGYPMVDAGMRQLNATGYMHNRVRMITAGFLCKHLLIDWQWGEAYFAHKLLDFELAANNGNWQWAAGTGCDAAPYFRIFNPMTQHQKFDPQSRYVKKWVPEYGTTEYPAPMVDHAFARERALSVYKIGLSKY